MSWMSALEPTSTPHARPVQDQHARRPCEPAGEGDALLVAARERLDRRLRVRRLDLELSEPLARLRCRARRDRAGRRAAPSRCARRSRPTATLRTIDWVRNSPLGQPVLRHVARCRRRWRRPGRRGGITCPSRAMPPASGERRAPNSAFAERGASAAEKTGDAEHLAGAQREIDVLERTGLAQARSPPSAPPRPPRPRSAAPRARPGRSCGG